MAPHVTDDYNLGKLRRLQNRLEDLRAAMLAASDHQRGCRSARQQIESHINRLKLQGFPVPADVNRELELARIEESTAAERVRGVEPAYRALVTVVSAAEDFLRSRQVETRGYLPTPAAPMPDGSRPSVDDVPALRQRLAAAKTRDKELEVANVSEAEADGRIEEWMASRRVDLHGRVFVSQSGSPASFRLLAARVPGPGVDVVTSDHNFSVLEGLLTQIAPKTIRGLLKEAAEKAAEARGGWGLPSAEREALRAELDDEIFQLEVREEQMIEHLETTGVYIARRADVDPLALLITSVPKEARAPKVEKAAEKPVRDAKSPALSAGAGPRARVARSSYLAGNAPSSSADA